MASNTTWGMAKKDALHELSPVRDIVPPSERKFGLTLGAIFAVITLFLFFKKSSAASITGGLSITLLFLGALAPRLLIIPNLLWFRLGLLLHKIMNPVVMGVLFFVVITPFALIMRLFGHRPLRLSFEPNLSSYWIEREDSRYREGGMKDQF